MKKKILNRREFLKTSVIISGSALLAACTPKTQEATSPANAAEPTKVPVATQAPTTAPAAVEPVEIEFWNQMSSPANKAIFPKVIDDFMVAYPNIKVKYEISGGPPGGGNFMEVILSRVAAGNPPDTAMFWTAATQYAARGVLAPIDQYMATAKYGGVGKWYEMPFASCQWQGKTYALPTSAANGAYFLNGPWFKQIGASIKREDFPTTWDGLKELSAKFTVKEGGEFKKVGLVPWANAWWDIPAWFQSNGGLIYDDKAMKYKLDMQQNIDVFQFWVKWLDDQFGGDIEAVNRASSSLGGTNPDGAWWLNIEAFTSDGAWASTNSGEFPMKADYEVTKFPVGPSGTKSVTPWGPNWEVVLKGAKYPYEGFLFNEYFCTIGWERWYIEGCPEVPAWKDAPTDMLNTVLAGFIGADRAREQQQWFRQYLEDAAASMWSSPVEDYALDVINSALDEALHKTKSPEQALKEANKLCQAKLDDVMQGKF
jgi:multiple sugar transport system substrate-binding protein